MIALFVLILLLASNVRSGDDYEEMQSMIDINELIWSFDDLHRIDIATAIWSNPNEYLKLTNSQKYVIIRQIACEARPKMYDEYKQYIGDYEHNKIWKNEQIQIYKIDCDNVNENVHHKCLCDPSSSGAFCYILYAKNTTNPDLLEIEKMTGELPCADELWREADVVFNNSGVGFLKAMNCEEINEEALIYADYTNGKRSMNDVIQDFYENDYAALKTFCVNTPKLHRILRKLRNVDIRFRIYDDLFKAKFLSLVPFNFCNKEYFLSKCLCDKQSSAVFCSGIFIKHATLTFVNETMCDDYDSGLISNTPPSLSISIVAIVLLSSLVSQSF